MNKALPCCALLLLACSHAAPAAKVSEASTRDDASPQAAAVTDALSVEQAASASVASQVVVAGKFMGFGGGCAGAPPTRSAWHLSDDTGHCIYVIGPLPAGCRAIPPEGLGTSVRITGTVRSAAGTNFIQTNESAP
jgi:hypothetical protein